MPAEDVAGSPPTGPAARLRELAAHPDAPLACVAVIAVVAGVYLRWQALGFPAEKTFDEHHFVDNARNYIAGRSDWNDHPPLGKLLIAASIGLFGDNGRAWRIPMALVGCLSIFLSYVVGRRAFSSWRAGALAAAFLALDGFFIVYSRTALLDGLLASAFLATTAVLVGPVSRRSLLGAAVLIGIAISIKFSGVVLFLPLAATVLSGMQGRRGNRWALLPLLGLVSAVVYVGLYDLGLTIGGQPRGVVAVFEHTARLWAHHAKLTDMTHPLTSYWYTWFLPGKPIWLRNEALPGAWARVMVTLSSPLMWWGATLAALGAAALGTRYAARARTSGLEPARIRILVLAWAAPILPWIVSARDSYIYHFLPAYGAGVVLLGCMAEWLYRTRYLAGLACILVVLFSAGAYAPLASQIPIPRSQIQKLLWLREWRP